MSLSTRERGGFIKASKDLPIDPVDFVVDATDREKYVDLLTSQYLSFMTLFSGDTTTHSEGIYHGFITIGQILQQVPEAYARFLIDEGGSPNFQELREALIGSFSKVIEPLASTDNRRNKTLETWLIGNPIGIGPSYEFKRHEKLKLAPKLDNLFGAAREIMEREDRGDLPQEDSRERCPALSYVLPKIWQVMASSCIERTDLFKHDVTALLHQN